jgi:hypothetical protein
MLTEKQAIEMLSDFGDAAKRGGYPMADESDIVHASAAFQRGLHAAFNVACGYCRGVLFVDDEHDGTISSFYRTRGWNDAVEKLRTGVIQLIDEKLADCGHKSFAETAEVNKEIESLIEMFDEEFELKKVINQIAEKHGVA